MLEAAQLIAKVVQTDARNAASVPGPSSMNAPPTTYPYGLENLSEDEDMTGDSSQSSDSPVTNGASYPSTIITTSQLARALSRAGTRSSGSHASGSSSSTSNTVTPLAVNSTASTGRINPGIITSEMFSQAIQQAFAATPRGTGAPVMLPQASDFQRQLGQMHEIGLMDDTANLQALQFTNGDVEAAIELVFSGFSDNIN